MLKVTLKGLRTHLVRLVATMLAVLLGVGFMTGTQVLGATLKQTFDEVFADVYANVDAVVRSSTVIATPFGDQRSPIDEAVADEVRTLPDVAAAEGQVEGLLRMIGKDGEPMGNPNGGPPTFGLNWLDSPELNGWALVDGAPPAGPDQVVLDKGSADDGGFAVGDEITLDITTTGPQAFQVVGIATFGELDDFGGAAAALFTTASAQELLGEPGKVSFISVAATDGVSQDELVAELRPILPAGTETISGADFIEESADPFREFIDSFTRFITIFGYIALGVGAFIIYNTFNVILAQRTRELALLRAIGASSGQVLGSVVLEAALVGVVASAIGIGFGIVLATGLRSLLSAIGLSLPDTALVVEPLSFLWPVGAAITVTLLSAALPAWRAARVPPIAALTDVGVDRSGHSKVRLGAGALIVVAAVAAFARALGAEGNAALLAVAASLVLAFLASVVVGPLYSEPLATVLGTPLAKLAGITGRLARENARRNPARTATTAAALTISVGLVMVIAIAASSASASINAATEDAIVGDLVISSDSFQGLSPALTAEVAALPEVATATGLRLGFAQIRGAGEFLLGVDPPSFERVFDLPVDQGSFDDLGPTSIAVSASTARDGGLAVGDAVPLTFTSTGGQFFTLAAIYEDSPVLQGGSYIVGQEAFDANFPPTFQADAQIFVELADGVSIDEGRAAVESVTAAFPTAEVQDVDELKASQSAQVNQFVAFLYSLLGLSVIIALIGVVNTLLLAVYERVRELGLLRAVGTSRGQVRSTIVQESVIIALIGTFLGLVVGIVFGWALVQALASGTDELDLTFALPIPTMVVTVVGAVVAGVLAGLYPAWKASRLNVLESIATE